MPREKHKRPKPRGESTEAEDWGGSPCSSVEILVMGLERANRQLVGDFKNGGRELRPKGRPEPVRVHDFVIPELGKAVPYGIYDIADNVGWVNLGISHDTAVFSVESIRRWWYDSAPPAIPP